MRRREFLVSSCAALSAPLISSACSDGARSSNIGAVTAPAAPSLRTLTPQEVMDLMTGSSIQSTRNSDTAGMQKRANDLLNQGKQFQIVAIQDVPDDWNVICAAGGIGGGGAWEHVRERTEKQRLPTISGQDATIRAMDLLAEHMGVTWNAVISNEASGGRIGAFTSATARGLPVIDACLALRCKPEVHIQMPTVMNVGNKPAALVSRFGDQVIIDKTADDYRIEDLGRAIAVASAGSCSIARTPLTGREVKTGTIPGALTQAILFGKTVREAAAAGQDPVAALAKVAGGVRLFQGVVTKAAMTGERGHSYWDVEIRGTGDYTRHTYKVWVKNENIASWLDGQVDVMPPDLICQLDPKTGDAVTGVPLGGYPLNKEVAMLGIPAHSMWRSSRGIEVFGPRYFGYDWDYAPLEELQARRRVTFKAT
jgi:DUF917 family protein